MINRPKVLKFSYLLALLFLAVSCEKDNFTDPNDPRFGDGQDEITLDFSTTHQTIHHFGASGGFAAQWVGQWPNTSKDPIAKLFFSTENDDQGNPEGIGLSMWRVNIGDGARDQASSGFATSSWFRETQCFLDENGSYDWTKQAGSQWFLSKARDYDVPSFTAWITAPPYFMSDNGYTFRTSDVDGFNCPESNYQDYASFLANVMKHYEDEGYNFDVVSPFNETQYDWAFEVGQASQSGTKAFNSEVAEVSRLIDQEFTDQGVNAKIMIPETAQLRYLFGGSSNTENQLFEFFDDSSPNYLGDLTNLSTHVAAHSYFSNNTAQQTISERQTLRSTIANYAGLDYWQTEYSLLGTSYRQGQDVSTLTEMDYSIWLARIIHADLVHSNATGWSFWTALNLSTFQDHPFRFNLILYEPNVSNESHTDGTFTVGKNLWAFGNYSRFVRPGMVRFEVLDPVYDEEASLDNFMISGYKSPSGNDIVLVCVNNTDEDRQLNLAGYATDFEVEGGQFNVYTTSATEDLVMSTANFNELVIPSKSIVTLTAELN